MFEMRQLSCTIRLGRINPASLVASHSFTSSLSKSGIPDRAESSDPERSRGANTTQTIFKQYSF